MIANPVAGCARQTGRRQALVLEPRVPPLALVHLHSTEGRISMSASNQAAALFCLALISVSGYCQQWSPVPQSTGSDATWQQVICEPGTGWQKCVPKPVKQCFFDTNNHYETMTHCRGMTNNVWTGFVYKGVRYDSRGGNAPSKFSIGAFQYSKLINCVGNPEPRAFYQICVTE